MYKRRLKQIEKINIFVLLFLTLVFNSAYCLSTDSEQNIEIEADAAEMDDVKNITTYRGNVIVTQGSIRMTGHTMTVYFDDNRDMMLVIMDGTPAKYRQLPDLSLIHI